MANELKRSKRIIIGDDNTQEEINTENLKLLKKYERDMQMRELSNKSIYSYRCDLMAWMRYLVINQFNPIITELNEDDIEEFIFYCKEQGNNTERIKRRMASLSAFYKFLRRKRIIKENPMEFIPRPKKGLPVVVQTFLTKEQYQLMKKKLEEQDDFQLKVYALFSISTMARVNAVSNVTWSQIDFDNRTVDDVLEKEGKIVTLYFSIEVKELLLKLKKEREEKGIECDYVFVTKYDGKIDKVDTNTLTRWAKKIGEMIDVPTLHPHDFRHSGSQLLMLSGMPIESISSLLNHSGLDVTKNHYLKEDKRKMQKEKDKFEI
ncbi:tyrosine-type recombinase/integrase [Clostridium botulinum]|uniref:tyrosine-type recombinase/integrase n=1 Tax=Clostridium botulinum TaxID=1491 RepID=UPI001375BE6D|nr:tyrosine-type recombinase/integrase [Clostridium botulinum]NCI19897.1 tyrosine-type recombinase/integrase [Clostridium botulinum]NCI35659.1 tyrosine-type recombinase/integrase [Clostridium botulinum]NCI71792.1 tyrosine-type recombinase/integrase [Clostridium botulinum]NDI38708.1 tyrosine-type recombinase/integrase [Clostridium botulinum]